MSNQSQWKIVITLTLALMSWKTSLLEMGRIDGIAYNETIWSARFIGDRAYIVTFENIDPLWIIDLSNPTSPTIMGELCLASTYIHPLSDDAILSIGLGPADEETGLSRDWSNTPFSIRCLKLFRPNRDPDPLCCTC